MWRNSNCNWIYVASCWWTHVLWILKIKRLTMLREETEETHFHKYCLNRRDFPLVKWQVITSVSVKLRSVGNLFWFLCDQGSGGSPQTEPQIWNTMLNLYPLYKAIISPTALIYVFNFNFLGVIRIITEELQNPAKEYFCSYNLCHIKYNNVLLISSKKTIIC